MADRASKSRPPPPPPRPLAQGLDPPLRENRQQVCYANGLTSIDYLTCGVPQLGSILGLLLFLIYINAISKCLDYVVASRSKDLKGIASWLWANRLYPKRVKKWFYGYRIKTKSSEPVRGYCSFFVRHRIRES